MTALPNRFRAALCAGVALMAVAAAGLPPAVAEDAKVLATVDGETITSDDVKVIEEIMGESLKQVPEANRGPLLVNILIETLLVAGQAERDGVADSESFKRKLRWRRLQALRDAYVEKEIDSRIAEADVKQYYDSLIQQMPPQEEVHARHILVKTEDEARALIGKLDDGADFAELAKQNSTGPTAPNGGDLGYFAKGRMVPEFEQAAFAMKPGEVSKAPVKSQFGWHVIKIEDRRMAPPPPFDEVKARVRQRVQTDRFREAVKALRDQSKIEVK